MDEYPLEPLFNVEDMVDLSDPWVTAWAAFGEEWELDLPQFIQSTCSILSTTNADEPGQIISTMVVWPILTKTQKPCSFS